MKYKFIDILKEILEINSVVDSVKFIKFDSNNIIQNNRALNDSEKTQFNKALEIRAEYGFSFWESLMATYSDNKDANFEFLKDALKHNSNNTFIEFSSKELDAVDNFIDLNYSNNIAFVSEVETKKGKKKHIPLFDFHIYPSDLNLIVVEKVLECLNLESGFIINSGKSYHFISTELVDEDELIELLNKMILYSPIIDRNWIIHQLLEKKCAIRITKGEKIDPVIVKRIKRTRA